MAEQQQKFASLSRRRRIGNIASYIGLTIISIIWIIPFVFLVLQAFDVGSTGFTGNILPEKWGFGNFVFLFSSESNFLRWYFNTFMIIGADSDIAIAESVILDFLSAKKLVKPDVRKSEAIEALTIYFNGENLI